MKILKLKSNLFSLMAVVMITMFLSSCEEDTLIESTSQATDIKEIIKVGTDQQLEANNYLLKIPKEVVENDVENWLKASSNEEIMKYEVENPELSLRTNCGRWVTYDTDFYGYCGDSQCWGWDRKDFYDFQYRFCDLSDGWFTVEYRRTYLRTECHDLRICD